ncbi:MAG: phosphopentomutase [Desulfuromonadales bacterium]|nr:phosphopentomutase [Desulfuromonadales bacterium]
MFRRVILIVLDGVGIGELPDAARFNDQGAHTLLHVAEQVGGISLPNLQRLGLGNIAALPGVVPVDRPSAAWGKMAEQSQGKDTTNGHWELAGLVTSTPMATYPDGFPGEILKEFRAATGLEPLGNIVASGTDILRQLGEEHLATGRPIIYTSADSVFQIAAHESIIPPEQLYDICRKTRKILDSYRVSRVIARPFIGRSADTFCRTSRRHDFAIPPAGPTVLDRLVEAGHRVTGIGKIRDIFAGRGICDAISTVNNADGMQQILSCLDHDDATLLFANLVDFDMLYGHRLDSDGFARSLEEFDQWLPELMQRMRPEDLLIVTADHGCDPLTNGTEHTREYVPLLAWHQQLLGAAPLGIRESFSDVAATIAEIFALEQLSGKSFLTLLPD